MRRHLRLLGLFVRASLSAQLEYRANFISSLIVNLIDLGWSFFSVLFVYAWSDTLGGWRFHETLIVLGLLYMGYMVFDTVFWPNITALSEDIRKGTMDFILTKPVNSQFLATLRHFKFERVLCVVVGGALIGHGAAGLDTPPDALAWLWMSLLFGCASVMLYALMTLVGALAFWVVNVNNLAELVNGVLEFARYPAHAFPAPMRAFVLFVIPIAFLTTVPAEALLGRPDWRSVLYGVAFTLAALWFSTFVWRLAVRNYSSASS